jgi:cysteine desulfurase
MAATSNELIYLDHNATTPIFPEVVEAMRACWNEPYLNPASQHEFGRRARRVLEEARDRIGELLGALPNDKVIFTSGGTEANNLASRGLLGRIASNYIPAPVLDAPAHVIISAGEHPSVMKCVNELQRYGHTFNLLPLSSDGTVRVDALRHLFRADTTLVGAILGQNETGVLQPIADLANACHVHGIPVHTDACQVAGKLPVSFHELRVATMSVAAHKFAGPLGIGALIVQEHVELQPQLFGGFQQSGVRPGTESVALAVGMRTALELWHEKRRDWLSRLQAIREQFETAIRREAPESNIIGANAGRLPNTSNIAFIGLDRQALFLALDQAGVACSTGSACASGSSEPSPVHIAMGCGPEVISSALRFSFGVQTTAAEVGEAVNRITRICNHLRREKLR